ncbi:Alkaline phosphatase, tissue-nonspecific isozyme, partial [Anas platyrhynchos]
MKAFLLTLLAQLCLASLVPENEKDPEYWRQQAQETLRDALRLQRLNQNVAKNLILFLGDGEMGTPQRGATGCGVGQRRAARMGQCNKGVINNGSQITRAPKQTAGATGRGSVPAGSCGDPGREHPCPPPLARREKKKPKLLLEMVISVLSVINSKRFGVISSEVKFLGCFLLALHTARVFLDITLQPSSVSSGFASLPFFFLFLGFSPQVILGGGRKYMFPKNASDVDQHKKLPARGPGLAPMQSDVDRKPFTSILYGNGPGYKIVGGERENVSAVDFASLSLGLFEPGDMVYELDRNNETDPSLTEMVAVAIRMLQKNPRGFFLLAEGG